MVKDKNTGLSNKFLMRKLKTNDIYARYYFFTDPHFLIERLSAGDLNESLLKISQEPLVRVSSTNYFRECW